MIKKAGSTPSPVAKQALDAKTELDQPAELKQTAPAAQQVQLPLDAREQVPRSSQYTEGPSGTVDQVKLSRSPSAMVELRRADAEFKPRLSTGWNFDWDDNIFFMPTEIMLYHKETGAERGVATHEFALMRDKIGQPGEWQDYEEREGSYRFFREGKPGPDGAPAPNHFVDDVQKAMQGPPERWQGPSWDAFVKACRRKETADGTTLITARGHSPDEMYEGLKLLQQLGYLEHIPPRANIFPVTYPPLLQELGGGSAANPSNAKVEAMKRVLDRLQASPLPDDPIAVVDALGTGKRPMHLWGFSDDDFGNYQRAVDALSAELKKGRWPDVKISVFFTGTNNPDQAPRGAILTPDGGIRPLTDEELALSNASWRGDDAPARG